jgi:hypothetical protein
MYVSMYVYAYRIFLRQGDANEINIIYPANTATRQNIKLTHNTLQTHIIDHRTLILYTKL